MTRNELTAARGVPSIVRQWKINLEDGSRESKQKRTVLKAIADKLLPRKDSDKQNLHTSQGMFWRLRQEEQDFFPLVLLNIHAYISEPNNILGNKEKYKACVWLPEFQTASKTTDIFSFQPESFQSSLSKFNEAPDELITILEQYNSDIRTRDVAEEMVKYAMGSSEEVKTAFYFLMDKIKEAIDNPRAKTGTGSYVSERMRGLRTAYQEVGKAPDARAAASEQGRVLSSKEKVREFLLESIEKDDGVETSLEQSWHVEHHRAVSNILQATDDPQCSKNHIDKFLTVLSGLLEEPRISTAHRHFDLATLAFVEIVSGARQVDFYQAIDALRDFAKHHNQQHKHLLDEIMKLRDQVAKHKKIIVCLEYRHLLEHLSQEGENFLVKIKNKDPDKLKKATPRWKEVWELAVETELLRMCQEKDPQLMQTVTSSVAPVATSSSTTSTQPQSAIIQAVSAPSGPPAASTNAVTQPSPPVLDPPRLKSLLQNDFNFWYEHNEQTCKAIVNASVANLASRTQPTKQAKKWVSSVSGIPYQKWSSYQYGTNLYGDLSNEIHGYGEDYDVAGATWLESHRKILEWLKPLSSKDDKVVDWAAEWSQRELPL